MKHGSLWFCLYTRKYIKALLLLVSARASDAQRAPMLSPASSKAQASTSYIVQMSNDDLMNLGEYQIIASAVRRWDKIQNGLSTTRTKSNLYGNKTLSGHSAQTSSSWRGKQKNQGSGANESREHRMIPSNFDWKNCQRVTICRDEFGNLENNYAKDGTVRFGMPCNNHTPHHCKDMTT